MIPLSDYNIDGREVFERAYIAKSAEINDNRPLSTYRFPRAITISDFARTTRNWLTQVKCGKLWNVHQLASFGDRICRALSNCEDRGGG